MRSALAPFLVFASVACSSLGPTTGAEACPTAPSLSGPLPRPASIAPAPRMEVVDVDMHPLPTFVQAGRRFVLGTVGERYTLHIVNPTPNRVEAVVSVDGLDAVDGHPARLTKRGYLVAAYGDVTIDGWRTSLDSVAAFRFSSVESSYAARTGHDPNVGVIGVAFFRERPVVMRARPPSPARAAPAPASASETGGSAQRSTSDAAPRGAEKSRPGIGTEFGEEHDSHVSEAPFERASSVPDVVAEVRYDDREGLVARGIRIPSRDARDEETEKRDRAEPFPEARFAQPPR